MACRRFKPESAMELYTPRVPWNSVLIKPYQKATMAYLKSSLLEFQPNIMEIEFERHVLAKSKSRTKKKVSLKTLVKTLIQNFRYFFILVQTH